MRHHALVRRNSKTLIVLFLAVCLLAVFLAASLLVSCAATPTLTHLPTRVLERKAVLPEGVTEYRWISAWAFGKLAHPFTFPLYWEQGISRKTTLIFMPLPLEIRHLIYEDAQSWLTLGGAFLGQIESRNRNFDWRPTLQLIYRKQITPDLAYEMQGLVLLEVTRDPIGNPGSTLGAKLGLWHQPASAFAWGAGLWIQREQGTVRARYVGEIPPGNEGHASLAPRWRYPLGLDLWFSLSRQWEIRARADLFVLGYPGSYWSAPVFLSLAHLW